MTNDELKNDEKQAPERTTEPLESFWPEESVQEILDYIEEQGIYIRE